MTALPFFEAPGGNPDRPRILLVSWHFPPGQTAGALRWEQLARHAARRGWEIDVLTLDPAELGRRDDRRLAQLPAGTRVFAVSTGPPPAARLENALHRLWRWARGNRDGGRSSARENAAEDTDGHGSSGNPRPASLAREETRLRPWSALDLRRAFFAWLQTKRDRKWAGEAVRIGRQVVSERTRLVVSCGPPHFAHEAARRLGDSMALPRAMDLRDPWSQVQRLPEHHASPVWYALAAQHERRCVEAADLVVANTEPARDALARKYPTAADRMITVMNGYDDEPMPAAEPDSDRFVVAHAGTVYLDRDPRPLFAAVRKLVDEQAAGPDRLAIEFIGCTADSVRRIAAEEGIEEHLSLAPFVPRDELRRHLLGCAVLVVLPQDSDMAIPSKVFEYLRYPDWVLALAEPGSATERVLRDTPAAVVSADDTEALQTLLREWFLRFQRGERPTPAAESAPWLSRRAQADLLFDRLERYRGRSEETGEAKAKAGA